MQNSGFWTQIANLYGSQISRVVLYLQSSVICPRTTCLYGSQPFSVVLNAKQRLLGQNYKSVWDTHNSVLSTSINRLYWFQLSLVVLFMQNSNFWTRISSLYGSQTSSVILSTHNCVLNTRIKRLYVFQPSPVVLCIQNSDFSTWIASLYGSQTSSVFFACKTAPFGPE